MQHQNSVRRGIGSRISLIVRHRWLGDGAGNRWVCNRAAVSLYDSPDPTCPGCGVEIRWAEVPRVERFVGVSHDRILGEDLGVRLDLVVMERALAEREALRRAG